MAEENHWVLDLLEGELRQYVNNIHGTTATTKHHTIKIKQTLN